MSPITILTDYVAKYVTPQELAQAEQETQQAQQTLLGGTGAGNDFLGWLTLPTTIDKQVLQHIKTEAATQAQWSDVIVVIGIGGSYLGARAVIEALQSPFAPMQKGEHPTILFAGHTLSEDYYHHLLQLLDKRDYSIVVVSKSGTTTEPAVAFRILKAHLNYKYGADASKRILVITDENKGALHDIAQREGYHSYIIPDNVGGRFSVLTPVGLLPIAMAGFDIESLLRGAAEMQELCTHTTTLAENPALHYAALRNILYRKGRKVEMLVNFTPSLCYISEWWKQLYGESEGKEGRGILPHSLSFTTDLHSMGQYVQQGERILFESMLTINQAQHSVNVPPQEDNTDGIGYLANRSLTDINAKAQQGTAIAHHNGNVPIIGINIPQIDEYTLGALIYFFEFACGISGYMLGVNPFDQPGVEAYKKNMFALLGKPGYEDYRPQ
ncbi:MAG: glucose-6-phosphate isomerase [Bacteroidales bacterium]|nr:glucose-6-phosphate isomerase [Bacteroidales bacterium]